MKNTIKILIIMFLAVVIMAGCAKKTPVVSDQTQPEAYPVGNEPTAEQQPDYPEPTTNEPAPQEVYNPPLPADAVFQVVTEDGASCPFNSQKIIELPSAPTGDGGNGPVVLKVLEVCSMTTYNELVFKTLEGTAVTLTKDQVTDKVVLGYKDGAVQLTSPDLSKDKWLAKVVEIRVK